MPNKRISELPQATVPLVGDEELEIIQSGANKRVAVSEFIGGGDGGLHYIGDWGSSGAFPASGGNGTGGAPGVGDIWRVTHDDGLTVGGNTYPQGSLIMSIIDTPGQTLTNWVKFAMQL